MRRMEDMKQQLKTIIIDELKIQGVTPADIGDKDPLFGDGLGLDSLDAVELVVVIQKHFGVQIADMDEGRKAFESVQTLAAYITEHKD